MGEVVFRSDRHFQLWRYTVSHGQLLLRSVKGETQDTRIDVLFKGTAHLDLPTSFDGLTIEREGDGFNVNGDGWSGRVTGLAVFNIEDDGGYWEPSTLEQNFIF